MQPPIIFRQCFDKESSTFTYLIGDATSGEAAIIDPVLNCFDRDFQLINELGLKIVWVLDTHVHADHITGAGRWRDHTGAKTAISAGAGVDCTDRALCDGDLIQIGDTTIRAISTPGHTRSCMSYFCAGRVFTGDALLIRGCGRTDFQEGSSKTLFASVRDKLFALPDETSVYPAHDYRGLTSSTIGEEKRCNPRLGLARSLADFESLMASLCLDDPKKMAESLPANLACGRTVAKTVIL